MATLLGRLTQFGSFLSQGELLCTQGLTYLLCEYPEARTVMSNEIAAHVHRTMPAELVWAAEVLQPDRARVDIEGQHGESPVVKIEAKLTAPFGTGQLRSYKAHLQGHAKGEEGVLVVLVPAKRAKAIEVTVRGEFALDGPGPWKLVEPGAPVIILGVMSWEEVLAALARIELPRFRSELEQFEGMYRELISTYIAPLTPSELIEWVSNQGVFLKLVDQVTRRLAETGKLLPMGMETLEEDALDEVIVKGYNRRFVCAEGPLPTCYSIGVRHPFDDSLTPVWLRFHKDTVLFADIRNRLESSAFASKLVRSAGHIWLPLDVPTDTDGEQMVNQLVAQVQAVWKTATAI
jgi:hypothetical protein